MKDPQVEADVKGLRVFSPPGRYRGLHTWVLQYAELVWRTGVWKVEGTRCNMKGHSLGSRCQKGPGTVPSIFS